MKDDLVRELRCVRRDGCWGIARPRAQNAHPLCVQAADEIERLRARVAELEATVNEMAGV